MSKTTPKYTTLRGQIFWFHYKLPSAIYTKSNLSSPLVRLSLNTRDSVKAGSIAQILVIKLCEFYNSTPTNNINKLSIKKVIIDTMISLGEATTQSFNRTNRCTNTILISSAFERYKREMVGASVWRIKTESDYHAAIANLIELMTDIEITSIDANFCREYKDKLIHYPLHRPKTRHIKNAEVNEIINSKTIYPKISTTTVNNQIRKGTLFSIG